MTLKKSIKHAYKCVLVRNDTHLNRLTRHRDFLLPSGIFFYIKSTFIQPVVNFYKERRRLDAELGQGNLGLSV